MHFRRRPDPRAIERVEGSESVWDYPRPPRLESVSARVRIVFAGETIADTTEAYRVLETSHPPNYYLPADAFVAGALVPARGSSHCEWKGEARYYDVAAGGRVASRAAWGYDHPTAGFVPITGHVAVYAGPMDACLVGDDEVTPQPGGFNGGPGTDGW